MEISEKELWDALRQVACSSKPYQEASKIVMLSSEDIVKAFQLIRYKRGQLDDLRGGTLEDKAHENSK